MHKKLVATLTIAIFIISTLAIVNPTVSAHFTLGNLTNTYRYHTNDFDPHVCGIIGYVWPGGGLNTYSGSPNIYTNDLSPGYQSPYPGGNPPGAPANALQLEGDEYAPYGAVLAGSTGDLIIAINATAAFSGSSGTCGWQAGHPQIQAFSNLFIMIPPEFSLPDSSQVITTTTNNYEFVRDYGKLSPLDRFAPNWWLVRVRSDSYISDNPGGGQSIYFNSDVGDQWYYVRINGVKAPSVAGRYFFKLFLRGSTGTTGVGGTSGQGQYWVPVQNWPVMLVKGEVDPAIITGTIRYAGYNSTLYGQGVKEAGQAWAHMDTKLDPYTGATVTSCPAIGQPSVPGCTDAVGYFNATAGGHYEVEGVAPGIYDLYAEAAGYPQVQIATGVTVLKGQSLHFDGYLQPGAVIHGNVYTKHQFGEEPWPENSYIRVDLYANPTISHNPDASAGPPVTWSPLPCVAGGQDLYSPGADAYTCGDPRLAGMIAFPWHEYNSQTGYANSAATLVGDDGSTAPANCQSVYWCGTVLSTDFATNPDSFECGINSSCPSNIGDPLTTVRDANINSFAYSDPAGVGPPQNWFVQGGTTTPFHYEMGVKGEYGAPRDFSGEVPQKFATWVNGLTPGRYYVRAWVFRYVQSALDGSTFQEYSFDVSPKEWAGDVTLPLDLRLSSWVNKTVYFHNLPGEIQTDGINTGAAFLTGALVDANGLKWAWNVTTLPLCTAVGGGDVPAGHCNDIANGFPFVDGWDFQAYHANPLDPTATNANCNTPGAIEFGRCNLQLWGINDTWVGANYGIPSGTYQVKAYALGYVQQTTESVSVTLSGNPTQISDHLYRGVGFNLTAFSIDWERPRVNRNWVWGVVQQAGGIGAASDIEIGILQNSTLVSEECTGCDAGSAQGPYGGYGHPYTEFGNYGLDQDSSTYFKEADGGGRNINPTDNAQGAFFGLETPYPLVGGFQSAAGTQCDPQGISVVSCAGHPANQIDGFHYGFTRGHDTNAWDGGISWTHASHFDSGSYSFQGWTYGYIQDKTFNVYALKGQVADIKINLIVGVNVTLDVLFKKEGLITGTPYNMSARVRLFNDQGVLVGEWESSEGAYVTGDGTVTAADNTAQFQLGPHGNQGFTYLPGGTKLLHLKIASFPALSGDYGDPVFAGFANGVGDWEVDTVDLSAYPNAGILGYPDYTGGWTAEIDTVPIYRNNTGIWDCQPDQIGTTCANSADSLSGLDAGFVHYYPPVTGLLMGESYHIIPGTTATSGISLTEDGALGSEGPGHTMAYNHLGPYSQQGVWQITNAHLSGEASGEFEVDQNGFVSGNTLAFTWSNEFRPLSWGAISVTGASGASWNFYTYDGYYEMFLPSSTTAGTYSFSITAPGYTSQTWSVSVSPGQTGTGQNVYLEQSNIPVPEFSGLAIVAVSALAASLYLLRRRRR